MKQYLVTFCFVVSILNQISEATSEQLQKSGFSPTVNGYRPTAAYREVEYDEEYDKYVRICL